MSASPRKSVWGGIVSVTIGGRLGTVTWNRCVAKSPSSSVAVMVATASPLASPVTMSALPDTAAPATALSETAAR